jgi:hypothetical protein
MCLFPFWFPTKFVYAYFFISTLPFGSLLNEYWVRSISNMVMNGAIIIIIIIILDIFFMQGIYTYISEKNPVPRKHCVATILM